jgi:hypothetical protein
MRITEFLRKGVLKAGVGGIKNRIKLHERRDTFFFEEIGARYVEACDSAGRSPVMEAVGEKWMALYFKYLLPSGFRKMPPKFFLNVIVKKIWVSMRMMDYFRLREDAGAFEITTRNEGVTRIVGANSLMTGFYKGILASLYGYRFSTLVASQSKTECRYLFAMTGERFEAQGKGRQAYDRLNRIAASDGFGLKDAIKSRLIEIKDNSLYYRSKAISPIENTLFHIIGNEGIMLDSVASVAQDFFSGIVDADSDETRRAVTLKTLLQVMGWGMVNIKFTDKEAIVLIKNPACGLQLEKDNWEFLAQTMLGYLRLSRRNASLSRTEHANARLRLTYALHAVHQ